MSRKILFLAANPRKDLNLEKESQRIKDKLKRSKYRDEFQFITEFAVRLDDLRQAMLENNPQIVHFAGHGVGKRKTAGTLRDLSPSPEKVEEEGIVLEANNGQGELVSGEELAKTLGLFAEQLECVILNGCYTEVQAKAIAQKIDFVIGMQQSIDDNAAINFAAQFYAALGQRRSYEWAYQFASTVKYHEQLTPVLLKRKIPPKVTDTSREDYFSSIIWNIKNSRIIPFLGTGINLFDRKIIDWKPQTGCTPNESELARYLAQKFSKVLVDKVKAKRLNKNDIRQLFAEKQGIISIPHCPKNCSVFNPESTEICPLLSTDIIAAIQPNLECLVQCIELLCEKWELYAELHKIFESHYNPNKLHSLLAELPKSMIEKGYPLPYQLIVTTNYDDTLEEAFKLKNQSFDLVTYISKGTDEGKFLHQKYRLRDDEFDIQSITINKPNEYGEEKFQFDKYPVIIKLCGAVNRQNVQEDNFVITEDQYLHYISLEAQLPSCLKNKLTANPILFLGCDPSDWKLRALLWNIWSNQDIQHSYVIQENPRRLEQQIWKNLVVDIYQISLKEFTTKLDKWQKDIPQK